MSCGSFRVARKTNIGPKSMSVIKPMRRALSWKTAWRASIHLLAMFSLLLMAVAPQADDYWQSDPPISDKLPELVYWLPQVVAQTPTVTPGNARIGGKACSISSSRHSTLVDPDGDAYSLLTKYSLESPHFTPAFLGGVCDASEPCFAPLLPAAPTKRGPPLPDAVAFFFSLRAPPLG